MRRWQTLFVALAVTALAGGIRAQIPGTDEIKRILDRVEAEMKEIDRLLLESAQTEAGQRIEEAVKRIDELLDQTQQNGEQVVTDIDELIKQLQQMGGGGGGQQQRQEKPQDQQQEGQQRPQKPRDEIRTEDVQQRPDQQEGKQEGQQKEQDQPQDGKQPQDGQEKPDPGENRTDAQRREGETGPGKRGTGDGGWGELQPYMNFLRQRGSPPKVPEKFRKYYEAYLRSKEKK